MIFELVSLWSVLMGILFALYGLACFVAEIHRALVAKKQKPSAAHRICRECAEPRNGPCLCLGQPVVEGEPGHAETAETPPADPDTRRQSPQGVYVDTLGRYCFVCPNEPEDPPLGNSVPYTALHAPKTPHGLSARR